MSSRIEELNSELKNSLQILSTVDTFTGRPPLTVTAKVLGQGRQKHLVLMEHISVTLCHTHISFLFFSFLSISYKLWPTSLILSSVLYSRQTRFQLCTVRDKGLHSLVPTPFKFQSWDSLMLCFLPKWMAGWLWFRVEGYKEFLKTFIRGYIGNVT